MPGPLRCESRRTFEPSRQPAEPRFPRLLGTCVGGAHFVHYDERAIGADASVISHLGVTMFESERRRLITSTPHLTPEQVAQHTFATSFRGYSEAEVRA